jgi:diaminohydroxyphosphoribosylaminopyrimidine deaminase / 5-amino-6-(5-phosphoribosylamino)uracil reductase
MSNAADSNAARVEGESAFNDFDRSMMLRALELAALGRYSTHPNPRVGCVIVQGERIVGEGWHRKWGEAHAEPLALAAAGEAADGSTVYVTLEPHSYHGRTPPCTDALIRAKVARVICAALDSNPQVRGAGVRQLQAAGIEVQCGLLEAQSRALNAGFEKRMLQGLPRVIVKLAASLDGRIALANGVSQWLSGTPARADVQRLRGEASAVLTGISTALQDDPRLTVRDAAIDLAGRQPLRVVLDSQLRLPATARMLDEPGSTHIFTCRPHAQRAAALRARGAQVHEVPAGAGGVDLPAVLRQLAQQGCNDVLVEAGACLAGQFFQQGCVDELVLYLAPLVLGHQARGMLQLPSLERLEAAPRFQLQCSEQIGQDLKLVFRAGVPGPTL